LGSRIANIATIILALFAYLPTIRTNLPLVPRGSPLDWVILFSIVQALLALAESFIINSVGKHDTVKIILWACAGSLTVVSMIYVAFLWYKFKIRAQNFSKNKYVPNRNMDKFEPKEWECKLGYYESSNKIYSLR
jgi:hypothetical protein